MAKTVETGSRTLSRFGVGDEQIYLVIRDTNAELSRAKTLFRNRKITTWVLGFFVPLPLFMNVVDDNNTRH